MNDLCLFVVLGPMMFVHWYAMQCPRDFHSQKKRERKKKRRQTPGTSGAAQMDGTMDHQNEPEKTNELTWIPKVARTSETLLGFTCTSSREGDTLESHSLRCSDKGPADCMATMWAWWMDLKHFRDLWSNPFFIRNDLTILLLTCSGCTRQLAPTYSECKRNNV